MAKFGLNVKRYRKIQQFTLKKLSSTSSVSLSMLSEIERGAKSPTIEVACKIADALGVSILELLGRSEDSKIRVIRKNERPVQICADSYQRFLLSPSLPFSMIEFEYCVVPCGKSTGPIMPHNPPLKEYLVVASGKIALRIASNAEEIVLDEGDSIAYQIGSKHEWFNGGDTDACFYYISENRTTLHSNFVDPSK